MNEKTPTDLPMIGSHPMDEDEAACSPKNYVSLEEKTVLAAMRSLRERAMEIRAALESEQAAEERDQLKAELADLRARRAELEVQRKQASIRKMIMLGHLPPEAEHTLF